MLDDKEARKRLYEKYGDKIVLLEDYKGYEKIHKFFCYEVDPITKIVHGEFKDKYSNLLRKDKKGCHECNMLYQARHWKLDFFKKLNIKYPNQKYIFLGVSDKLIKFPRFKDKLLFKCEKCGLIFENSPHHLLAKDCKNEPIICTHCSIELSKPVRYWTKDRCLEAAKTCSTKKEFRINFPSAYQISLTENYLKDFSWLKRTYVIDEENNNKYYIYEYNFRSLRYNNTYIGLTKNLLKRKYEHRSRNSSSVFKFCYKNNIDLKKVEEKIFKVLEEGLTGEEAQEKEHNYIKLRKEEKYNLLNIAKTGIGVGSLGGGIKKYKTIEECIDILKQFKSEGHTLSEANKALVRPLKLVRDAKLLDEVWPERKRLKNNLSLEEYEDRCIKFIEGDSSIKRSTLYSYFTRKEKKGNKKYKEIYDKIVKINDYKLIEMIDSSTGEVLDTFKTAKEASSKTGITVSTIRSSCAGLRRSSIKNVKFRYKNSI